MSLAGRRPSAIEKVPELADYRERRRIFVPNRHPRIGNKDRVIALVRWTRLMGLNNGHSLPISSAGPGAAAMRTGPDSFA